MVIKLFEIRKKKRHIQSLEVDDSIPRNVTRKPVMKTKAPVLDDVQEIVRIVELQDDEVRGVAPYQFFTENVYRILCFP